MSEEIKSKRASEFGRVGGTGRMFIYEAGRGPQSVASLGWCGSIFLGEGGQGQLV